MARGQITNRVQTNHVAIDLQRAADGNEELRRALEAALLAKVTLVTGPPPACGFSVAGQDGNFVIDITNPDVQQFMTLLQRQNYLNGADPWADTTITHQLQAATNRLFDAAGDVRGYGPDTAVHWEITGLPDQSRYWRLRSSYDGGTTWNPWREFRDPLLCGVVPVWSGLVRSVRQMPATVVNTTNYATVTSIAEGSLAAIEIYGTGGPGTPWSRKVGSVTKGPYPAGSLHGYLQNTAYKIYFDVQYRLYRAFTAAQFVDTLDDRYIFVGVVTTAAAGGMDAAGTAVMSGTAVVGVTLTNGGTGYLSPPEVYFNPVSGGTGASATAILSGGVVVGVSLTNGGTGYTAPPQVWFLNGRGVTPGGGGAAGGRGGAPYGQFDF